MPADAEKEPRREPEHEDVVATLLGLQARLRGETARTQLPHFVEVPGAANPFQERAVVAIEEEQVVRLPEVEEETATVIRLPEAARDVDETRQRLTSILERLDLLEEDLTSLMARIEDRAKA